MCVTVGALFDGHDAGGAHSQQHVDGRSLQATQHDLEQQQQTQVTTDPSRSNRAAHAHQSASLQPSTRRFLDRSLPQTAHDALHGSQEASHSGREHSEVPSTSIWPFTPPSKEDVPKPPFHFNMSEAYLIADMQSAVYCHVRIWVLLLALFALYV